MSITTRFSGIDEMREEHQRLFLTLAQYVGEENLQKVWQLYISTGLIYKDAGSWKMWGDKDSEGFSKGPIPHSAVVAATLVAVASKLQLQDPGQLVLAALLHDAFKRDEIESGDPESSHARASAEISQVYGTDVAELAELSGHNAMPEVLKKLGDYRAVLFFWADNAVVGTKLQKVATKCDYLIEVAPTRYPYNKEGQAIYGEDFFDFQRHLAITLEAAIAMKLGKLPTNTLHESVIRWIEEDFGISV